MKQITRQTFLLFWRHSRRYGLLVAIQLIVPVAAVLIETTAPLFYKRFFDILAVAKPDAAGATVAALTRPIIAIFILGSTAWALWRIVHFVNNHFQPRVLADLADSCFEYLHEHSYRFFVNRFVGALVRKVNRLINAYEGVTDKIQWDLLPLTIRTGAILVVLFWENYLLGAILLAWTIIYLGISYGLAILKLPYDEKRSASDTIVTARLADSITNNANIKLFTAAGDEHREFGKLTEKQFRATRLAWNVEGFADAIQSSLMVVLEFSIFYVAIRFWSRGMLTVGDFVLIQTYLMQMLSRLWGFGRIIRDLYRYLADAEEMVEILETPHEVQDNPNAKPLAVTTGVITFRDISFDYAQTRTVIKNFSLDIAAGEKVGLVGPSGAGKSTLVALLLRFYDLTSGQIIIDGQDIADVTQESLRAAIGYVPQDPILFHRTLMENIRYGRRDATDAEVLTASQAAHCDEFINQLPDGYQTYVGERGIKLSGGERQRVAIARAILKNAPILLLDEATSSLDSHAEKLIQEALRRLMEGKTTIVIAHRLSTIMKMDRIVVVRDGRIHEVGTHETLVHKSGGLYKQLWELQAGGFIV
ncbi:MAG: ABC transporter ATP-binding protein [Patescibacteria group bacterium]|nr:ABC transporter ATP-binding protein [Patescibacteria group bacterium]